MDLLTRPCHESALDVLSRAALMLERGSTAPRHQPGSSGSSVSAGLLASVAPAKRSLSADRQQTWTSATDHHHDNERHEHQQPRPASSSSLSSLQRRTSSSSLSSLSRKCPRLDVMDVSVSVSRRHDNETETDADLQQQQWQPADSTHKSAGTQTFLSSFLSSENSHQHQHLNYQHHHHHRDDLRDRRQSRTFSQAQQDSSEMVWRSSCEDDVPLNLSLSSVTRHPDSRPQHQTDFDPRQPESDPPHTSSALPAQMDGTAWRRSRDPHRQSRPCDEMNGFIPQPQQSTLRRPESSPELRKSSSAVVTVDCDRDIEEHFRRSLGRDYSNYLSQSSGDSPAQWSGAVVSSSATTAPCNSAVVSSSGVASGWTAQWSSAVVSSSASTAPCNSAVVSSSSVASGRTAQWSSAVVSSSASTAPCNSAVVSSSSVASGRSLSDLLSTDAETCDSSCDVSKKCCAISITGSVDDHFAKSLGSTWTRIKTSLTNEPSRDRQTADDRCNDVTPADNSCMSRSVDDHFAKALGDAWFRIKAEQEGLVAVPARLDQS